MSEDLLRLLCINAYRLSGACLVGNPAPKVKRLYDEITNPKPGDLVFEVSAGARFLAGRTPRAGGASRISDFVGRLVSVTYEPYDWDPAELAPDEKIPTRDVWTIERIDGSGPFRWEDCKFIKIIEDLFDAEPRSSFDRTELLGSLSDSGFDLRLRA